MNVVGRKNSTVQHSSQFAPWASSKPIKQRFCYVTELVFLFSSTSWCFYFISLSEHCQKQKENIFTLQHSFLFCTEVLLRTSAALMPFLAVKDGERLRKLSSSCIFNINAVITMCWVHICARSEICLFRVILSNGKNVVWRSGWIHFIKSSGVSLKADTLPVNDWLRLWHRTWISLELNVIVRFLLTNKIVLRLERYFCSPNTLPRWEKEIEVRTKLHRHIGFQYHRLGEISGNSCLPFLVSLSILANWDLGKYLEKVSLASTWFIKEWQDKNHSCYEIRLRILRVTKSMNFSQENLLNLMRARDQNSIPS